MLCFKCSYQIVLAKEGRAKALKIYNRARDEHSQGGSLSYLATLRDNIVYPNKNLSAHQVSDEMKELRLL